MHRLALCLLVGSLTSLGALPAQSTPRLRENVARHLDGAFGKTVRFAVEPDQAARIAFAPNPYHVTEFLLLPDAQGRMWFEYGEGPSGKSARVTGALEQLGQAPCAALAQWHRDGATWRVELTLTDDRAAIAKALSEIDSGRRTWAKRLRNHSLLAHPEIGESERIAGFVRLWSEVKYNFVYFDRRPRLDWEKVLDDYLPRVQRAASAPAYYRVLRECMALLQDGHSEVSGPSDDPVAAPPIVLREIEGKAIVVGVRPPDSIPDDALRREIEAARLSIGDEVTTIDGEAVADVLATRIHPFVCASTPQHRSLVSYPQLLRGDPGTVARLGVRARDGTTREVTLTRGYLRAHAPTRRRADGEFESGLVHVALPSFSHGDAVAHFERLLPTIRSARGLILDLRDNGGGSTRVGNQVLASLTDKPLAGSHWRTRMYRPAFRAWGSPEAWHHGKHDDVVPGKDPWLGPIVVLTGPRTFSAAEDFLVVLKAAGRARLVGEPTGGSTGQPLAIEGLPGGGHARVCAKRDTFPDGTEFVGVGVLPDVDVRPTVAGLVAGRDEVFERGVAELRTMIGK